jgi:hypothetical protein
MTRKNLLLRRNDSFLNRQDSVEEREFFAMHNKRAQAGRIAQTCANFSGLAWLF